MTALSVLARIKLVYQKEQGKGKSSDTSHFPGSFKKAKEGISMGDLKVQLWTLWVAFPQLHLSGLVSCTTSCVEDGQIAVMRWTQHYEQDSHCRFTTVLELATATVYSEKTY